MENEKKIINCDSLTEEERVQINKQKKGNGELNSTQIGSVKFKNNWGKTMSELTVRHRQGNNPHFEDEGTYSNLVSGAVTEPLSFMYETGALSMFDYWWIKFIVDNEEYIIKGNFYCSVSSDDDGEVLLTADAINSELKVEFSKSSSCTVAISKL